VSEQGVPQVEEPEHAGLGIASFATSIAAAILLIAAIAVLVMGVWSGGENDEESPAGDFLILAIMGLFGAETFALGLGIGGLYQTARTKVLAGLGIFISCVVVIMVGTLFVTVVVE